MCHATTHKKILFGLIRQDFEYVFDERLSTIGKAVNEARGNDMYIGVVTRILRRNGSIFDEKILIKNSRYEEYAKKRQKFRTSSKYSTMNF